MYKVHDWYLVEDRKRYAFNGELASKEILDRFVNKRIPDKYVKKGMASPVLLSKNM